MKPNDPSHQTRHVADLVTTWPHAVSAGRAAQMEWLHRALETAIRLEFATIPPYLMALWSIKTEKSPVAKAIREIVKEEMQHMALACNMLVAIGGTPPIAHKGFAPSYPGPLPGGVHSSLTVSLSGLTPDAVKAFLTIERPEAHLTEETAELMAAADLGTPDQADIGIGVFYDAILTAFKTISPTLSVYRQITDWDPVTPVRTLQDVEDKINLIKDQGEGTAQNPHERTDVTKKQELAHFYRFLEIHSGKEIGLVEDGKRWGFTGKRVTWPHVQPVAVVPAGGYDPRTAAAPAATLLADFDKAYGLLLQLLHDAWATGEDSILNAAIGTMTSMGALARRLMEIPIPDTVPVQNYAPSFRVRGHAAARSA